MKELFFLSPIVKRTIWGGSRLKTEFGYEQADEQTGECWGISAHPNGDCIVHSKTYGEVFLSELWNKHREIFGNYKQEKFPLLIKLIDAKDDLSIQVHPDDLYAAEHENGSFGKSECWLVLDCPKDGTIIIGTNAKDNDEVSQLIKEKRYKELLREIPIKAGDFFQIDAGCIHAIKKNTLILEIQQNSDLTYRIYDYDRIYEGKYRELHIDKGIEVIKAPYKKPSFDSKIWENGNSIITHYITNNYYEVIGYQINGELKLNIEEKFLNLVVLNGKGLIDGIEIKKGDYIIVPAGYGDIQIKGDVWIVTSTAV